MNCAVNYWLHLYEICPDKSFNSLLLKWLSGFFNLGIRGKRSKARLWRREKDNWRFESSCYTDTNARTGEAYQWSRSMWTGGTFTSLSLTVVYRFHLLHARYYLFPLKFLFNLLGETPCTLCISSPPVSTCGLPLLTLSTPLHIDPDITMAPPKTLYWRGSLVIKKGKYGKYLKFYFYKEYCNWQKMCFRGRDHVPDWILKNVAYWKLCANFHCYRFWGS